MKLTQYVDFKPLNVDRERHLAYEQTCPPRRFQMIQERALLGIEVEVENIHDSVDIPYYWTYKEDGSLRNCGAEFTSIPLRSYQVEYAMDFLHKALYANNDPDFSNRTSVHVHLNVRDMTWDQIKVLVLLYSIFERHFFRIAGTKRESSIFCVPLYKTKQLDNILQLEKHVQRWHKYTAVNCGTIYGTDNVPRFGTIEFRHLYGTSDTKTVVDWVNSILCLRRAILFYTLPELIESIKSMNTTSEYMAMYQNIFGTYCTLPPKDIEYCISKVKRSLWVSMNGDFLKKRHSNNVLYAFLTTQQPKASKLTAAQAKAKVLADLEHMLFAPAGGGIEPPQNWNQPVKTTIN